MYSVKFNFKLINKLGEEGIIMRLWDKREIFFFLYYSTFCYNNKLGFSLLIKVLDLSVLFLDLFVEIF